MPGHAGGGHSGGFSGGGHSSGGFTGGGHSGSFGGGSVSSNRSSGTGFTNTGAFFPMGTSGRAGSKRGCGCLTGIVAVVIIVIFAIVFVFGRDVENLTDSDFFTDPEGYGEAVTEIVAGKEKLDPQLCTPIDTWFQINVDGVISESDEMNLTDALRYFYIETGVQPYFILTDAVNGDADPDYDTIDSYLYDTYVALFGEDEGHFILLMILDSDYYYETWYITGDDAYYVMDYDSADVLLTYIDDYAESSDSVAEVIGKAFTVTADEIMSDRVVDRYDWISDPDPEEILGYLDDSGFITKVRNFSIGVFFFTLIVVIVLIVYAVYRKNKKKTNQTGNPGYGEVKYSEVKPKETPAPSVQSQTGNYSMPKNAFPVRCPNCGATAYPNENGTCQYCGSVIVK